MATWLLGAIQLPDIWTAPTVSYGLLLLLLLHGFVMPFTRKESQVSFWIIGSYGWLEWRFNLGMSLTFMLVCKYVCFASFWHSLVAKAMIV